MADLSRVAFHSEAAAFSELTRFIPGCVAVGVVYIWFNEVRYHSMFDRGVFIFAPPGSHLFGWEHFPGNFYTLFFMTMRLDEHIAVHPSDFRRPSNDSHQPRICPGSAAELAGESKPRL